MGHSARDAFRRDLDSLRELTEEKIQAVVARDSVHLMALVQAEIDPLSRVHTSAWILETLSPQEQDEIRGTLEHWASRVQYLADLIETQLGYVDFLRSILGPIPTHQVSLDL